MRAVRFHLDQQTFELVRILTRRELAARYRGSIFGPAWALLTPALMLAVFTFVFGVVLPSRWGAAGSDGIGMFALRLLGGLLPHLMLADALNRAPTLVTGQPGYVTKVVFPLRTLGWVCVLSSVVHTLLGLGVLIAANAVWGTGLSVHQIAVPLVLAPLALLGLGLVWAFGAMGVYVRDLAQLVPPLTMLLMFLGPVFYPRQAMPEALQHWLVLNPLTVPIEQLRRAIFEAQWPDWGAMAAYTVAAVLVLAAGRALFDLLRRGFADVL